MTVETLKNWPWSTCSIAAIGATGAMFAIMVGSACSVGVTPKCLAHCFNHTEAKSSPVTCHDAMNNNFTISFTGSGGYFGEDCPNFATQVQNTVSAIVHLRNGGALSDLSSAIQTSYNEVTQDVIDNIKAQCMLAAPAQCTDEDVVCGGVADDALAALLTNESCILGGGEPQEHTLAGNEVCEFAPVFYGFATEGEPEDEWCTAFETTGAADDTTGEGAGFGDIESLVSCDPQTTCTIDRELLQNVQANFDIFESEGVGLTLIGSSSRCGPGARIDGLTAGDESKDLADAFDLRNNDVIYLIDGVILSSLANAITAIDGLQYLPSTTMVIKRWNGGTSSCDTLTYSLTVE